MTGFQEKFLTQIRSAQIALSWLAKDASITFVWAISARAANPGTSGLAAINGAIEFMIKPLGRELKPVRVNAVSPAVVETTWWNKVPDGVREQMLKQSSDASLVGRNGKPEDLAEAICLLVSNSFITGTVLEVDGGLTSTKPDPYLVWRVGEHSAECIARHTGRASARWRSPPFFHTHRILQAVSIASMNQCARA